MRVLSFIPAFLLAAASFVVAAPSTTASAVPACTTSSVPSTGSGSGNDAALQPLISIFTNATTVLQPYSGQLSSCNDPNTLGNLIVEITSVVEDTVSRVQAAAPVNLSGLDLTNFCSAIWGLLTLIIVLLNTVLAIVVSLAGETLATVAAVLINLLNAILKLVNCLDVFVNDTLTGVLGPVLKLLCALIDLLLTLCGGLNVLGAVAN